MKKYLLIAVLFSFAAPAGLIAQEHATIGVFGDYTRLSPVSTNMWGLGARLGVNAGHNFALEGEMAYDFDQSYTGNFLTPLQDNPPTFRNSLHLWSGLFGPKLQIGGPVKLFVVAKGGFMSFGGGNPGFADLVNGLTVGDTYGVFYPGGGIEGHLGPLGLRLDVGDEIYFDNGAHNNLKVGFGPYFRF